MTDSLLKLWETYCADGHCSYKNLCEFIDGDCPVLKFVNYIGRKEFYQACRDQFEADLEQCRKDTKEYCELIPKMHSGWNELTDERLMSLLNTRLGLQHAIMTMNEQIVFMEKPYWRYY